MYLMPTLAKKNYDDLYDDYYKIMYNGKIKNFNYDVLDYYDMTDTMLYQYIITIFIIVCNINVNEEKLKYINKLIKKQEKQKYTSIKDILTQLKYTILNLILIEYKINDTAYLKNTIEQMKKNNLKNDDVIIKNNEHINNIYTMNEFKEQLRDKLYTMD